MNNVDIRFLYYIISPLHLKQIISSLTERRYCIVLALMLLRLEGVQGFGSLERRVLHKKIRSRLGAYSWTPLVSYGRFMDKRGLLVHTWLNESNICDFIQAFKRLTLHRFVKVSIDLIIITRLLIVHSVCLIDYCITKPVINRVCRVKVFVICSKVLPLVFNLWDTVWFLVLRAPPMRHIIFVSLMWSLESV